jgi:predicted aspartyl protease
MGSSFSNVAGKTLSALLLFGLAAPAQQTPAVIGQVVNSTGATQNGVSLPSGGTILDGDVVATGASGLAAIKLSAVSQITLNENTSVVFTKVLDQTRLRLQKGTVVVENSGKSLVVVATPKFEIQPAIAGSSKLYVGLMADKSTYIEAGQGDVAIVDTTTGQSYVLSAGHNTLVPENASGIPGLQPKQPAQAATTTPSPNVPAAQPQPAVPQKRSSSHGTAILIGLGAGGAAVAGVAAAAGGGGGGGQAASPTVP